MSYPDIVQQLNSIKGQIDNHRNISQKGRVKIAEILSLLKNREFAFLVIDENSFSMQIFGESLVTRVEIENDLRYGQINTYQKIGVKKEEERLIALSLQVKRCLR
jgi:hypothetical protein